MTISGQTLLTWGLALVSILLSASAQLLMKVGMTGAASRPSLTSVQGLMTALFNPYVLGGLGCYAISAVLWLAVLAKMPLSMAYPLVALAIALVVTSSGLFLGETLPLGRLAGVALIVTGVVVIGLKG